MEMMNLFLNAGSSAIGLFLLAIISGVIWWFVRTKKERLWLPILRIFEKENKKLPKLEMKKPPILSFLFFALLMLCLFLFTLQPSLKEFVKLDPSLTRTHLFVDLSPSVSEATTMKEYVNHVKELWQKQSQRGKVTLSTSRSKDIFYANNIQELDKWLETLQFHKTGMRLSSMIGQQLELLNDVNLLVVFSDQDAHSWNGFNWSYLRDKMDVKYFPVNFSPKAKTNAYISQTRYLSTSDSKTMDWDITIQRDGSNTFRSGKLIAEFQSKILFESSWEIAPDRKDTTVHAAWNQNLVSKEAYIANEPLNWKIVSEESDANEIDNVFYTSLLGVKQNIVLINDINGEHFLEDASQDINSILQVLGFHVERYDHVNSIALSQSNIPLKILLGGGSKDFNDFCPESFFLNEDTAKLTDKSKIWLIPQNSEASYQQLCLCASRLIHRKNQAWSKPSYCEDSVDKNNFANVLRSIGASQVGGKIGYGTDALAWIMKDKLSNREILFFTVPLSARNGFGYSQLPILLKEVLKWQGVWQHNASVENWVRINDHGIIDQLDLTLLQKSNVPQSESEMKVAELSALPPGIGLELKNAEAFTPSREDKDNPLPVLRIILYIVFFLVMIELILLLIAQNRKSKAFTGLFFALFLFVNFDLYGIQLAGFKLQNPSLKYDKLKEEVESRTSITFQKDLINNYSLDGQLLRQPWMWLDSLQPIVDEQGDLHKKIFYWLKKGGFLVLQGNFSRMDLDRLTKNHFTNSSYKSEWKSLPPDSELMRSFYLLDFLPECQEASWQYLYFDKRIAVVVIPFDFLKLISDHTVKPSCLANFSNEMAIRTFVNILMVATTTDYKKDQIHLPEILKRLR